MGPHTRAFMGTRGKLNLGLVHRNGRDKLHDISGASRKGAASIAVSANEPKPRVEGGSNYAHLVLLRFQY